MVARPTGNVLNFASLISTYARMYSFHIPNILKMVANTIPGFAKGKATLRGREKDL